MRAPGASRRRDRRKGMGLGAIGDHWLSDGVRDFRLEQAVKIVAVKDEWIGISLAGHGRGIVLIGNQNLTGAGRTADARSRLAAGNAQQLIAVRATESYRHKTGYPCKPNEEQVDRRAFRSPTISYCPHNRLRVQLAT
jgi:hypothetical protein